MVRGRVRARGARLSGAGYHPADCQQGRQAERQERKHCHAAQDTLQTARNLLCPWHRLVPRQPGEEHEPQAEARILRYERLLDPVQRPLPTARQLQRRSPVLPARAPPTAASAPVILILGMLPARIIPVGAHGSLTAGVAALARRCTLGVLPGAVFGGRQAGRPLDGAAFLLRRSAPAAFLPGSQREGQARCAYCTPETDGLGGEDLRQRRARSGDGKEKLGIFGPARTRRHPARGTAGKF